jgi:ABC-type uncharacterized transport system permease subunit
MIWLGIGIGLVVGAALGMGLMALCITGRADD